MRPREEAEAADGAGCGAVGGEALRGMRGCAYAMRGIALRGGPEQKNLRPRMGSWAQEVKQDMQNSMRRDMRSQPGPPVMADMLPMQAR